MSKSEQNLPVFKYHPDPLKTEVIIARQITCKCCQRQRLYAYTLGLHSNAYDSETDQLCPWCIADGSAAKKFEGQLIYPHVPYADIDNRENVDELIYRTPNYLSWQGEEWMAHCGDFCTFIRYIHRDDLLRMRNKLTDEYLDFLKDPHSDYFLYYLFQCLHCGEYRLRWDCP